MPNPWFRMYSEFADDPKVQMMTEAQQRHLVMIFCLRCAEKIGSDAEIAFALRIKSEELAETKKVFMERGFIDDSWNLINWNERQFLSDSSNERVKRYRDKRAASGLKRSSNHLSDPFLYQRDSNRCIYCNGSNGLCIDHIFPISQGGCDDYDNLGVACKKCNSGKSGRTPEQAQYKIVSESAQERYTKYVTVTLVERNRVGIAPRTEQNRTEQTQKQNIKTTPTTREKKEQRWLEYQESKPSLRWAYETFAKFAAWEHWDAPDRWPVDVQALQSMKQVVSASLGMYRREN